METMITTPATSVACAANLRAITAIPAAITIALPTNDHTARGVISGQAGGRPKLKSCMIIPWIARQMKAKAKIILPMISNCMNVRYSSA